MLRSNVSSRSIDWDGLAPKATRGWWVALGVVLGCAVPRAAFCAERQWHLGAGAGISSASTPDSSGAAIGLYAAYGISELFDARISWVGARHDHGSDRDTTLIRGTLGVVYKLDVIEWVPYLGVCAGYYGLVGDSAAALENAPSLSRSGGLIGTLLGVDYAFSRGAAVGFELDYDRLLPEGRVIGAMLRAEYRWGF